MYVPWALSLVISSSNFSVVDSSSMVSSSGLAIVPDLVLQLD